MPLILTIAGSPAGRSRSAALLDHIQQQAVGAGLTAESVILRDLPAEDLLHGNSNSPALQHQFSRVAVASGIAIATPVYKAAYTGVLKAFFDVLPPNALAGKIIFPLVLGGSPAHSLVLDYALKPVLAALGADTILRGAYLIDKHMEYESGFRFTQEETQISFERELKVFLEAVRTAAG